MSDRRLAWAVAYSAVSLMGGLLMGYAAGASVGGHTHTVARTRTVEKPIVDILGKPTQGFSGASLNRQLGGYACIDWQRRTPQHYVIWMLCQK